MNESNNKKLNKVSIILMIVFAIPAFLLIASSSTMFYRAITYSNNYTQSVEATIVGYDTKSHHYKHKSGGNHTSYSYYPIYEFSIDDTTYDNKSNYSYTQDYCTTGNIITVVYDPSNPNKNCIITDVETSKSGLVLAVVFMIIAIVIIVGDIKFWLF